MKNRPERWNGNTLRRYRFPNGAVLVTGTRREPRVIPAWCPFVSAAVSRSEAMQQLLTLRAE